MGSVELGVEAAEARKLAHLVAQHVHDVGHEVVEARIGLAGAFGIPEVGEQRRRGQGDLGDPVGVRAQERELLGGQGAALAQTLHHGQPGWALGRAVADLGDVGVPLAPQPGVDVHAGEAVDRCRQLALERLAAKLSVGDHRAAGRLLEGDHVHDGGVLHALEFRGLELAGGQTLACGKELRRAQQAADVIGVGGDHASRIRAPLIRIPSRREYSQRER